MTILVVGGGGREHAIVWKLAQSRHNPALHCAPGNAGIAALAACHPVPASDLDGQVALAKKIGADLVVVAPDDPLVAGLVDRLEAAGIPAFGPTAAAAAIEGSKVFSKDLMKKYGIRTAAFEVFDDPEKAFAHITSYPAVIKAEGLALGKGVVIAQDADEAKEALEAIMVERKFGDSGKRVVIEQFLKGPEVSVLAFSDGAVLRPMVPAQDHKRAFDNDTGPNTGGMGAFSPCKVYTPELAARCMEEIFLPTVKAMAAEGRPFKGVLYFGLMIVEGVPYVIEYNARFGDPETQAVLPRLRGDLVDIMLATRDGTLSEVPTEWEEGAAVCVVAASGGYPGPYGKGFPIEGLEAAQEEGALIFHAGSALRDGRLVTAGGRVLGVVARGPSMEAARDSAYGYLKKIHFTDMHYRKDIGMK
ncbi:MAG TPA: phosphoribosylamine--glycine ligase [Candidatus Acidoferrum sp.]|nr:phosphoribosylamine--glycine ligase [Candidatus Acidoferrum sp.]